MQRSDTDDRIDVAYCMAVFIVFNAVGWAIFVRAIAEVWPW